MTTLGHEFRRDINGLRALAVLAVLLYHFHLPWAAGGFVGVDVFFAISGYLMTGIIVMGLRGDHFSLWHFYFARARRIWPALLVLCLAVALLGWFILLPDDYRMLGKHMRDSLLFSSNLRYLEESGYFDVLSEQKWLLHTWSLSVEWQFYLIYPVLLLGLWRCRPAHSTLVGGLILLCLGSLSWSAWLSQTAAERAFFTLGSRAWEMALGGLAWYASENWRPRRLLRAPLQGLSLLVLLVSLVAVDNHLAWPLPWALPAVLATGMLLALPASGGLLGHYLLQWLGTRSYSIYLWHWPLAVLFGWLGLIGSWPWLLLGIVLAIVLGHLSFLLIEEPTRHWLPAKQRLRSSLYLLVLLAAGAVTGQVLRHLEAPQRLPEAVASLGEQAKAEAAAVSRCSHAKQPCYFGDGSPSLLLVGDSHAGTLASTVARQVEAAGGSMLLRARAGCMPLLGAHQMPSNASCVALQDWLRDELPSSLPGVPVLLVARYTVYLQGGLPGESDHPPGRPDVFFSAPRQEADAALAAEFRRAFVSTACHIASQRPLYLLRPIPEMQLNIPKALARDRLLGRKGRYGISLAAYQARHAWVLEAQDAAVEACGAVLLDPLPLLCPEGWCRAELDGQPLYFDDDHLSEAGAALLAPLFRQLVASPAAQPEPSVSIRP
ncbi:MAG: acyltransferase family protein [Pseudomonas sp.]